MNLAQMYQNCMAASYYSRTAGEVWSKLSSAGFEVYTKVLKERSGFFIKFDEVSLTLLPGQANQEYTLPVDLTQVVHLAERVSSAENWRPMAPANGIENVLINQLSNLGLFSTAGYGPPSPFSYFGPFLDASAAVAGAAGQTQKIRVSPIPDTNRFVQLVYTAKWIPIVNQNSSLMMPDEGTYAMQSMATAELLRLNNDDMALQLEAQGARELTNFLDWVRTRQTQEPPTVEPMFDW
jgi:hypothetical protein